MCQTLLIHLKDPQKALKEMARILKLGGIIMCKEPDNASNMIMRHFSTLPELDLDDWLFVSKIELLRHQGRINLGKGDHGIGNKVASMLYELGFVKIDCRINDGATCVVPPYETEKQKAELGFEEENLTEWDHPDAYFSYQVVCDEVISGGGSKADIERYYKLMREKKEREDILKREQVAANKFMKCGCGLFYVTKAQKPLENENT